MTGALLCFGATFISVFALGLQSQNVNQGHYRAAVYTSIAIGLGTVTLYKYMPSAEGPELAGYLIGGITGITASMWFHRSVKAWWRARQSARRAPEGAAICGRCGDELPFPCHRCDCPRHEGAE